MSPSEILDFLSKARALGCSKLAVKLGDTSIDVEFTVGGVDLPPELQEILDDDPEIAQGLLAEAQRRDADRLLFHSSE